MDGEIIADRLAATEEAVLELDQRIDAAEDTPPVAATPLEPLLDHEGRIAALEERLNECLTKLSNFQSEIQTAEAQAEVATALALEAESLALEATTQEPEPTEEIASEVEEIPSEPEEDAPVKSPKWWESLATLR